MPLSQQIRLMIITKFWEMRKYERNAKVRRDTIFIRARWKQAIDYFWSRMTRHQISVSIFTGTVIASRLSEDPKSRVLLLEAGPEEPSISSVPAFAFTAANSTYDWQFETVPQRRACLGNGGVCLWPRGKMLCGTACLSGNFLLICINTSIVTIFVIFNF